MDHNLPGNFQECLRSNCSIQVKVPTTDLVSIFCGYVRPTLEYAAPCWSTALTQIQSDALERVQKRACRIILGRRYNSYTETLALLDLQRLADRREHLCSNFASSVEKSSRFRSWLPPTRGELHGRNLRNASRYQQPSGTKRYTTSGIPALVRRLNEL
ncbi:hypothetical protein Bbelb_025900 [Branchiostoma belcheri]|nr:hypothetical protein Bbelb_025900 [Branchiostoma belcheri]